MIVPVDEATARVATEPVLLALLIWREARGESVEAKLAVAYSVLNRVARPSWWGDNLDTVIGKRWQYSSLTATGDPQLILFPRCSDPSWQESLAVARAARGGSEPNPVPGADSYYDDSITAPAWATVAAFRGKLGTLNFYDTDHDWEAPTVAAAAVTKGTTTTFDQELLAWLSAPKQ